MLWNILWRQMLSLHTKIILSFIDLFSISIFKEKLSNEPGFLRRLGRREEVKSCNSWFHFEERLRLLMRHFYLQFGEKIRPKERLLNIFFPKNFKFLQVLNKVFLVELLEFKLRFEYFLYIWARVKMYFQVSLPFYHVNFFRG